MKALSKSPRVFARLVSRLMLATENQSFRPVRVSKRYIGRHTCVLAISTWVVFSLGLSAGADAEWKIETVDQSGSGRFASMQIDTAGNVHVAYVAEEDRHPLKYAYWDHTISKWFTMTIAQYASFCTLALDSKQRPHISYADHGTGKGAKLRYIYWNGGAEWKNQPVSPPGDAVVGYYTSIALDAKDNPSFSFYDYEGPAGIGFVLRLRNVVWAENHWEVNTIDPDMGSGKFNSIAVDSLGHPHVAYANVKAESGSLRYASWDGNTWKTEILEGATKAVGIFSVALILDKSDNPHIAYTDVTSRIVKYATRRNGVWRLEAVDSITREAYPDRNGIALDDHGNVYISYYDAVKGTLKVATRKNGKWYGELVDSNYAGFTSSLQVHNGVLWAAYSDDTNGALKVAHKQLDAPLR
jgi:hypothetical protein